MRVASRYYIYLCIACDSETENHIRVRVPNETQLTMWIGNTGPWYIVKEGNCSLEVSWVCFDCSVWLQLSTLNSHTSGCQVEEEGVPQMLWKGKFCSFNTVEPCMSESALYLPFIFGLLVFSYYSNTPVGHAWEFPLFYVPFPLSNLQYSFLPPHPSTFSYLVFHPISSCRGTSH